MKRSWRKDSAGRWGSEIKAGTYEESPTWGELLSGLDMATTIHAAPEGTILTLEDPDPPPKQTWTREELERVQKKYAGHPMAISAIEDLLQQVEKGGA